MVAVSVPKYNDIMLRHSISLTVVSTIFLLDILDVEIITLDNPQ